MQIANPIYDAVFKFLMEDLDIAKGLLAVILDEEIEVLEMKPQETASAIPVGGIGILRYDFKAVIKTKDGGHKKVLIELQKAKHLLDIMRFRRYLGENYKKADEYQENGLTVSNPLDIVTIYLLGFKLENVPYSVLKSNNRYQDVLTGEYLDEQVKEPFVNLLDHEAYFIQIPRLKPELQTPLEKVLLVFNQDNRTDDIHRLEIKGQPDNPLVAKMLKRLQFAIADENVQRQMELEDEIGSILLKKDRIIEAATERAEEYERKAAESERKAAEISKDLSAIRQKLADMGLDPDNL